MILEIQDNVPAQNARTIHMHLFQDNPVVLLKLQCTVFELSSDENSWRAACDPYLTTGRTKAA